MSRKAGLSFDPEKFLASVGEGQSSSVLNLSKDQTVFAQGDRADAVFYIREGKVKFSVVSEQGKEAVVAILDAGDFFGEGCLAGQASRMATAKTMTDAVVAPRRQPLPGRHENGDAALRRGDHQVVLPLADLHQRLDVAPVQVPLPARARQRTRRDGTGRPRRGRLRDHPGDQPDRDRGREERGGADVEDERADDVEGRAEVDRDPSRPQGEPRGSQSRRHARARAGRTAAPPPRHGR